nr:DUF4087 domain-containing protein [uncultured Rhodoferax sp.]
MRAFFFIVLVVGSAAGAVAAPTTQTLCGWFHNPTLGNAWLQDRSAEWVVGIQGGHQAEGDWPEFKPSQWVKVNGSYGYGCACIKGVVNGETREVVHILSSRAQPLHACRKDRALPKPAA